MGSDIGHAGRPCEAAHLENWRSAAPRFTKVAAGFSKKVSATMRSAEPAVSRRSWRPSRACLPISATSERQVSRAASFSLSTAAAGESPSGCGPDSRRRLAADRQAPPSASEMSFEGAGRFARACRRQAAPSAPLAVINGRGGLGVTNSGCITV
eukprot:16258409-Heterocapsa_arctica.AAC.1